MDEPVLVVEDNDVNAMLVGKILKHLGHSAVFHDNGEDALAWCSENQPALILMDVSLPGMDGLEVTRRLREKPEYATVPIVALTAHALTGWEEKSREAGCSEYLPKPVRPRDLAACIKRHLDI
jgi:CheY-like chemotaxis protein